MLSNYKDKYDYLKQLLIHLAVVIWLGVIFLTAVWFSFLAVKEQLLRIFKLMFV